MASIRQLTTLSSGTDGSAVTSSSFTPNAGELIVVVVGKIASANDGTLVNSAGVTFPSAPNISGGYTSGARQQIRVAEALATNVAQTVTYDCTGDGYTGIILHVLGVSGMSRVGADAIKQIVTAAVAAAGTPATTFAAACETGNPTLSVFSKENSTSSVTVPTDWPQISVSTHGSPNAVTQSVARASGFTGTTITWGSTTAQSGRVSSVEFDTRGTDTVLTGTGFSDGDSFGGGSLSVSSLISGTGFADADSFGAGSVAASALITGTGFADADSFGSGSLSAVTVIAGTGFADADSFGAGSLGLFIAGAGFADSDAFGSGVLSAITEILGAGYEDPDEFGAGAVQASVAISGLGWADPDAFGSGGRVIRIFTVPPEAPRKGIQVHRALDRILGVSMIGFGAIPGEDAIYSETPIRPTDHFVETFYSEPTPTAPTFTEH